MIGAVILGGYTIVSNTLANLDKQGIASGFGFMDTTAGFAIIMHLVEYSEESSYGRVFFVGLLNTVVVSVVGIIFATILGFIIGVARLSNNWLISKVATVYIEIIRNIPLLLQIFFWYFAVLRQLPGPKQSIELFGSIFFNKRGLYTPNPIPDDGFGFVWITFFAAIVATFLIRRWAKKRQELTGQQFPVFFTALGLIIGLPILVFVAMGMPLYFDYPALTGFNYTGGMVLIPEFICLALALSIYTAAFIAEIVRAGIMAVSKGQSEAAHALGLRHGPTLRLVVIPQALRVIIPPLTSQYLNLTKNSSLAVAIAYPDLVSVFAGTTLMQTGQAVEIVAITMAVYFTLSLLISSFMNWYNEKMALVER
ncbi:MAG: amino acid ABC transporter permease [Rhodospirillaceae bacterium]|nr:amino acid ABC transporter permease [Rhodospirillaceae bacterium]